jgi:hypothetical protein
VNYLTKPINKDTRQNILHFFCNIPGEFGSELNDASTMELYQRIIDLFTQQREPFDETNKRIWKEILDSQQFQAALKQEAFTVQLFHKNKPNQFLHQEYLRYEEQEFIQKKNSLSLFARRRLLSQHQLRFLNSSTDKNSDNPLLLTPSVIAHLYDFHDLAVALTPSQSNKEEKGKAKVSDKMSEGKAKVSDKMSEGKAKVSDKISEGKVEVEVSDKEEPRQFIQTKFATMKKKS